MNVPASPSLPSLCQQLCAGGSGPGFDLARWLVMEEWTRIVQRWEQLREHPHPTITLNAVCGMSTPILALFESSVIADSPDRHSEMLRVLTSPNTEYPIRGLLHLLRTAHETRTGNGLCDLGLAALREHCAQTLTALLSSTCQYLLTLLVRYAVTTSAGFLSGSTTAGRASAATALTEPATAPGYRRSIHSSR